MMHLIAIFIGGGCGSVLRYIVGEIIPKSTFPFSTLLVNALGGLAIGLFWVWSERFGWRNEIQLALMVGLCGGFTTFSTFSKESLMLIASGRILLCVVYILSTLVITLAAVALGYSLAKG